SPSSRRIRGSKTRARTSAGRRPTRPRSGDIGTQPMGDESAGQPHGLTLDAGAAYALGREGGTRMDLAPTGFRPAHRVPETGVATWPADATRPTGECLAPGAPVEVFEQ